MLLGRNAMANLDRQCIKKQRRHFADKGLYSQSYGFFSGHVPISNSKVSEPQVRNDCHVNDVSDKRSFSGFVSV